MDVSNVSVSHMKDILIIHGARAYYTPWKPHGHDLDRSSHCDDLRSLFTSWFQFTLPAKSGFTSVLLQIFNSKIKKDL